LPAALFLSVLSPTARELNGVIYLACVDTISAGVGRNHLK
jgi:hypothetical protein